MFTKCVLVNARGIIQTRILMSQVLVKLTLYCELMKLVQPAQEQHPRQIHHMKKDSRK